MSDIDWKACAESAEAERDQLSAEVERLTAQEAFDDNLSDKCMDSLMTAEAEVKQLSARFTALTEAAKNARMLTNIMLTSPFWKDAIEGVREAVQHADDKLRQALEETFLERMVRTADEPEPTHPEWDGDEGREGRRLGAEEDPESGPSTPRRGEGET